MKKIKLFQLFFNFFVKVVRFLYIEIYFFKVKVRNIMSNLPEKMKALVWKGNGEVKLIDKDTPKLIKDSDAIVHMETTTICGTDLGIKHDKIPYMDKGTTLGHEGVGTIVKVGVDVKDLKVGDRVIVSAVSTCGICDNCKKNLQAHCTNGGGWIFGYKIDGTLAEYVRVPFADHSLIKLDKDIAVDQAIFTSDILPTGYEIGVLKANIKPTDSVLIVGAGAVGTAALLTALTFNPKMIIVADINDDRLELSKKSGATHVVNSRDASKAAEEIYMLTNGQGVDVAIEAVGYPATFDLAQVTIAVGGHISVVGVHGKPVPFNLNNLWIKNITVSTGLVSANTTVDLLSKIKAGKISTELLSKPEHRNFKLSKIDQPNEAFDIFENAEKHHAMKVIIRNDIER